MSVLDNLLDSTLDDLQDMPEHKPFAEGAHTVLATLELKEINGAPAVELAFKYVEAIELAANVSPEDAPKVDDTANTMFMMNNEFGQGAFKKIAKVFGEALGTGSIREIIEQVNDFECHIVTSIRTDKKDPDKKYLHVKELQVA